MESSKISRKKLQSDYANIRVLKPIHERMKRIVNRLGVKWVDLIDSIASMSDEEVDTVLRPIVSNYEKKKGISNYMLAKRLKAMKENNPEELQKFIDSL